MILKELLRNNLQGYHEIGKCEKGVIEGSRVYISRYVVQKSCWYYEEMVKENNEIDWRCKDIITFYGQKRVDMYIWYYKI